MSRREATVMATTLEDMWCPEAAVGFGLAMLIFSGIRERIELCDTPVPFKGTAIGLVTAGLLSLAFWGFTGLVKM